MAIITPGGGGGNSYSEDEVDALIAAGPSGAAAGDLTGTYPNPTIGSGKITNAMVSASAAIAASKLDLSGTQSAIDRIFLTGGQFSISSGTPSNSLGIWIFPDAATGVIAGSFMVPPHWLTMKISAVIRGNATAGNVVMSGSHQAYGDGDSFSVAAWSNVTITAPGNLVFKVAQLATGLTCTASKFQWVQISRLGSDGADAFAGNLIITGFLVERVT